MIFKIHRHELDVFKIKRWQILEKLDESGARRCSRRPEDIRSAEADMRIGGYERLCEC